MNYYIGIDSGGTYMKAALFNAQGQLQTLARRPAQVINQQQGWVERDLDSLWQDTALVLQDLMAQTSIPAEQIKGISISAQGKGVYLLDKQQQNLGHGIMSSDSRSLAIVKDWLAKGVHQSAYPLSKQTLWTGHPVSILRWIKENQPERYNNIGAVLMAHDYLRFRLTGEIHAEVTNMSESHCYHSQRQDYDDELLALFGLEELREALPPLIEPHQQAGTLTEQAAQETGLAVGTPVFGGLFDVVSTALCSGISPSHRKFNVVMGTWSVISAIHDHIPTTDYPFVYGQYANQDQFILHEASPTSASNYQWFADLMTPDGQWDHQSNQQAVEGLQPAGSDLLFVPFLFGSNQGLGIKAGFYGLQSHHTDGHMIQAIWEGIIFALCVHLDRLRTGFPETDELIVTGGPTANSVWMQMLADITNMKVSTTGIEEAGALGAAMVAMVGAGEYSDYAQCRQNWHSEEQHFTPRAEYRQAYQDKYQQYSQLVRLFAQFEASKHD